MGTTSFPVLALSFSNWILLTYSTSRKSHSFSLWTFFLPWLFWFLLLPCASGSVSIFNPVWGESNIVISSCYNHVTWLYIVMLCSCWVWVFFLLKFSFTLLPNPSTKSCVSVKQWFHSIKVMLNTKQKLHTSHDSNKHFNFLYLLLF